MEEKRGGGVFKKINLIFYAETLKKSLSSHFFSFFMKEKGRRYSKNREWKSFGMKRNEGGEKEGEEGKEGRKCHFTFNNNS